MDLRNTQTYNPKRNRGRVDQPDTGGPERCPRLDGQFGRYVRNDDGAVVRVIRVLDVD